MRRRWPVRGLGHALHLAALGAWRLFPWPGGRGRYAAKNLLFRRRANRAPQPIPTDVGWLSLAWSEDHLERTLYATGEHYERPVAAYLRARADDLRGTTVLDVGGHVGYYSLLLARAVGPAGRLVVFEPQTRLASASRWALEQAGCTWASVESRALGDRDGVLTLNSPPDRGRTTAGRLDVASAETIEVPVARADAWIDQHLDGRVDWLKIDVEGAEHLILCGLDGLFARGSRPRLLIEMHPPQIADLGGSDVAFVARLRQLGYRLSWIPVRNYEGRDHRPTDVRSADGSTTEILPEPLPEILPEKSTWHLVAEPAEEP